MLELGNMLTANNCRTMRIVMLGGDWNDDCRRESFTDFCTELRDLLDPKCGKEEIFRRFGMILGDPTNQYGFACLEKWLITIAERKSENTCNRQAKELLVLFQRARGTLHQYRQLRDEIYEFAKKVSPK